MKKIALSILMILLLTTLTACFRTRTELFNLKIEEDTYTLNENIEELLVINDKTVTYVSLSFKDLKEEGLEDDEFAVNTFGDYSYKDIKLFEIELFLGFDNEEPKKYDLEFLGRANPDRPNAYAFSTVIEELYNGTSNYRLVLELNTHIGGYQDRIAYYILQFTNTKISDYGLTVRLRNELESKRAEALKTLSEVRANYKREDYEQEQWTEIYNIERRTRESINVEMDKIVIDDLLEQALIDFNLINISYKHLFTETFAVDDYGYERVQKYNSNIDYEYLETKYSISANTSYHLIETEVEYDDIYFQLTGITTEPKDDFENYIWVYVKREAPASNFIKANYVFDGEERLTIEYPFEDSFGDDAIFACIDIVRIPLEVYNNLEKDEFEN